MNRKRASQELEHTVPFTFTPALALPWAHYMAVSKSQLHSLGLRDGKKCPPRATEGSTWDVCGRVRRTASFRLSLPCSWLAIRGGGWALPGNLMGTSIFCRILKG